MVDREGFWVVYLDFRDHLWGLLWGVGAKDVHWQCYLMIGGPVVFVLILLDLNLNNKLDQITCGYR